MGLLYRPSFKKGGTSGGFKSDFNIDMREFKRSMKVFTEDDFPEAIAVSMQRLTQQTTKIVQTETRMNFDLHTDWIPKGIKPFPKTQGQVSKVERDVRTKNRFVASVGANPRHEFMSGHDTGITRYGSGGKKLAVPGKGLQKLAFKTRTGKVKKRWLPSTLFDQMSGPHQPKTKKRRKAPFKMKDKKGRTMIVRRTGVKSKNIEVLWLFIDKANIAEEWNFTNAGVRYISRAYKPVINATWNQVMKRSSNRKYGR